MELRKEALHVPHEFVIFSGTANPELATAIASDLGVAPGACAIDRFPDGETSIQLQESVRRKEVFLVQPLSPPVNEHFVELLAVADACRRAAAARITAVVPYLGYARSDKRHGRREPIMGRMVADVLEAVGGHHVVTVDLHAPQIEGFFGIPVDVLTAVPRLATYLSEGLAPRGRGCRTGCGGSSPGERICASLERDNCGTSQATGERNRNPGHASGWLCRRQDLPHCGCHNLDRRYPGLCHRGASSCRRSSRSDDCCHTWAASCRSSSETDARSGEEGCDHGYCRWSSERLAPLADYFDRSGYC